MKNLLLILLLGLIYPATGFCREVTDWLQEPLSNMDMHLSPSLKIFALLVGLSLLPSLLIMMTSFTRIMVVLSLLRTAIGLQQTPPNSVLISIGLFLTVFTMIPVGQKIYVTAVIPYSEKRINETMALKRTITPIRRFMLAQTHEKDLTFALKLAKEPPPQQASKIPLHVLILAFMLSELQTAFQIGFMIFLPFLIIDLIVSGLLMTLGMMMLPPASIALPLKLLLFISINGFELILEALVSSFRPIAGT